MVEEVLDGRSLTEALADVDGALRPAVQAVSFHAMRYLGWADAVGRELVQRYPNVLFESLLLVSLTLLKAEGEAAAAVPGMPVYAPHTVVDQAVTAASKARALAAFKGLLNGCLRRFLREREALAAAVADSPEAQWNHPGWWVKQLRVAYPQHWQAILQAANLPAPLTLRVNRRRASREQVLAAFQDAGLAAEPVGAAGLVVATPRPVVQLPGFAEGWWSVQDAGAQRAAELLAPADGMRVLDACAARAARPPTCWSWRTSTCWPWTPTPVAWSGSARTWTVLAWAATGCGCRPPTPPTWTPGGTASPSTPCWPTCRAPHLASCGAIPTSAGCAAKTTCAAPPRCRPASWMPCGAPWRRAGACCT